MNMTTTVAVTQNFCSVVNFPTVWHKTVRGRPKLSRKWSRILARKRPEMWQIAQGIDTNVPTGYERFVFFVKKSTFNLPKISKFWQVLKLVSTDTWWKFGFRKIFRNQEIKIQSSPILIENSVTLPTRQAPHHLTILLHHLNPRMNNLKVCGFFEFFKI